MKKVTATWNPSDPFRSITNAAYHIGKENDEKTREEFLAAQLKNLNLKGTSDVFLKYCEPRIRKSRITITPDQVAKAIQLGGDLPRSTTPSRRFRRARLIASPAKPR